MKKTLPIIMFVCLISSFCFLSSALANPCLHPETCDDGDECTLDICDLINNQVVCSYESIPGCGDPCKDVVCDDSDPCTDDLCDPFTGLCAYIPNDKCVGGEGCTPGYWKNHLEDWPPTGYSPADDFDTTFGVDLFDPDISLGLAVNLKGGGVKRLGRHGTAALLSAAHPAVDYPLTVDEVIAAVQAGDAGTLTDANELGCDIP